MKKEYMYAGVSVFLWSTTAAVTKLLLRGLESIQIMLASSVVAFIFLLILNLAMGTLKELKKYRAKDWLIISGVGFLGIFAYHLLLYMGIDSMDASQAFIINYLWPIMAVVFGCIILKEKMTMRKLFAVLMSFAGVVIVTANGNILNVKDSTLIGAVYCIAAAVSYGLFTVLNKKTKYNKYVSMMLYYLVATVISGLYILFFDKTFELSSIQMAGMCWVGIFATAIPFTTWALALDKGDTAKISNIAYVTPFLSLIWTTIFLSEKINIYSVIGLLVIVAGILIQFKNTKKYEKINR